MPEIHEEKEEVSQEAKSTEEEDDEPDEWDQRIFSTGCRDEQLNMNDCWFDKKDWRACQKEVEAFKKCWKRNGNDKRTDMKNA